MRKRLLACFLALCLCAALLPASALAAYTAPVQLTSVHAAVIAPQAGMAVEQAAVTVSDSHDYIASYEWKEVAAAGSTTAIRWMFREDTFDADRWYCLELTLAADFGFVFADDIALEIEGAAQTSAQKRGDDLDIYAWYRLGDPKTTTIQTIEVTEVAAPTVGISTSAWTDAIEAQAKPGVGYTLYYASAVKWTQAGDSSHWEFDSDTIAETEVYGVTLYLETEAGYAFAESLTSAKINGQNARVLEQSVGSVSLFLPFGDVTITNVKVASKTWPIDGNAINKTPENFYAQKNDARAAYTLESAAFQIWESGSGYRDLTAAETTFDQAKSYRVMAVLQACAGARFAETVTGDFNGTSGVSCTVSPDGKTCTVTRSCAVYDPICTYPAADPTASVNGVTVYRNDPVAGQPYELGDFSPTAGAVWLRGASATAGWYEVPYVGSTTQIKQLKTGDTFEDGKVYLATLQLRNQDGFRFGDGFTVTFRQKNESASNYALLKCVSDTAKRKEYNVWYTVGEVTPQPVTELAITGPALQPDGSLATDDLTAFSVEGSVITSASFYQNTGNLSLRLVASSGHYFDRTVMATYNGAPASISYGYLVSKWDVVYVMVNFKTQELTVAADTIQAENKTYDGTTAATLSGGSLLGLIDPGDDVRIDYSDAKASFNDPNVGAGKTVTVAGTLRLTGADAGKYQLSQPDLTGLTADITPCQSVTDHTQTAQTVYAGEGAFQAASFGGVNGETATGTTTYTVDGQEKTTAQIEDLLRQSAIGAQLSVAYVFAGTGNYAGASASGTITVTVVRQVTNPFTDVPSGAYYEEAVLWTVGEGVTSGTSATTFTPDGSCTRAQAVSFLWRIAGRPAPKTGTMPFADVKTGAYYYDAVLWAMENGITYGTSAVAFSPDATCTRAQIVSFLYRYVGSPAVQSGAVFSDVGASAYYVDAVAWAATSGVAAGIGGGKFAPDQNCTRAQIVSFIYRMQTK